MKFTDLLSFNLIKYYISFTIEYTGFKLTTIALLAMYMFIWLVVFFSLLPFDVNRNRKFLVPANEVGAPENPKMLKKTIYCTGITTFVFIILLFLIKYEYLNLKNIIGN